MMRVWIPFACLVVSGCMSDAPRRPVVDALPPIAPGYKGSIVSWARTFFADRRAIRDVRISDPVPTRDSRGRLMWLVCVEADAGPDAGAYRHAPHAFGFAPDYVSSPLERRGSSLSREDCAREPLRWRPFPELSAAR